MKFARIFFVAALFTCFYTANADAFFGSEKTYDIEILVFSHITPKTVQTERWPLLSQDTIHAFDNIPSTLKTIPTGRLSHEEQSIQRDGSYRVLLHSAWQGTWSSRDQTLVIPIKDGKFSNGAWSLNGIIRVKLDEYFNTHVNLFLTEPMANLKKVDAGHYFNQFKQPYFTFQLLQNQRMRSDELNYIGNSLIGMLIKITPANQSINTEKKKP